MASPASYTLFVRPYIYKFCLAKLSDRARIQEVSSGTQLWLTLTRAMPVPVVGVVNDYHERRHRPCNQLRVLLNAIEPPVVERKVLGRLNLDMETIFYDDLCANVDLMRAHKIIPKKNAILFHLERNGIEADVDMPYVTAQRMYLRHEHRMNRPILQRRPRTRE